MGTSLLPGVANVSLLAFLVIFIYACLGVSLYGGVTNTGPVFKGNALSHYTNFGAFPVRRGASSTLALKAPPGFKGST